MSVDKKHTVPSWLRLDNAAKIYPAAKNRGWMPMFRVSVTFKQEIDRQLMQQALDNTLLRLPHFAYRLRKGLFWHYFDQQNAKPKVGEDARNPMLPFNLTGDSAFMFRLRVHKRRAALEVFHVLTDGHGALTFLLTLAAEYLFLKTGQRIPAEGLVLDTRQKPRPEEWQDSFSRVARGRSLSRKEQSAWQMKGTRAAHGYLQVVTGIMPTQALLDLAKSRKTTVNTLLAALIMLALMKQKEASRRGKRKPVKLSLPVNLRRYYQSGSLRNFSFYVNVPARSGYGLDQLDNLITFITHFMGLETMEAQLNARFSANVKAEQNKLLRIAPLFLKSLVLKAMYRATGERYMTSTLTNLGRVSLPAQMEEHIERMGVILGPAQRTPLAAAVISACGQTCLSFSKTIRESEVERQVFTSLIKLGVPVKVESN